MGAEVDDFKTAGAMHLTVRQWRTADFAVMMG
jgi:hypothetical protein